jgi:TonB family protein
MPPAKLLGALLILTMAASTSRPAPAQATPPTQTTPAAPTSIAYDTQPLPKDPVAALQLASQANGLGGEGLKPWYLKAHYQTYDAQGKPAAKGIFELYWAAEDHYRVSYTEDIFSLTTYHTPEADYVVGSTAQLPYADTLIWPVIMHPLTVREKASVPESHERKSGQVAMNCLEFRSAGATPEDVYCFDGDRLLLRAAAENGYSETFNRIGLFQHRFSAGQINIREDQQQVLLLEQDSLRGMRPGEEQALVPPADARKVDRFKDATDPALASVGGTAQLQVAPRALAGHPVSKAAPTYPAAAKQRGVQGTVRIAATIDKDGSVHNLLVVHDPDADLSKSALDAVSKWQYRPYLLDGAPVEVQTTIFVTYRLGR